MLHAILLVLLSIVFLIVGLLEKSAMDLYTSLIFDLDIDSHVDTEHPMLKCYSGFLSAPGGWRLLMMTTLPRLFKAFRVEFPNKGDSQYALDFTKHLIERRLRENEDEATYESLRSMVLLDAVVSETLRMYSPTSVLTRICSRSTTIAGVRFTPGMRVEIPAHAMHYDPEFFPEPESFKPERFLPEHKDSINTYTYLPFGVGPRSCIGMRMGMVQVKYILYRLLQNVTFEPCAETQASSMSRISRSR
ncbi:hypothetical protein HPB52_011677 [Rhipicephalus sanguineus]|uniref:Cytochrome P450 n=1 Tax=Rhipicephalus sanguineus TaxID=34632 RepID=A0A9D4PVW2_RHISA|nr:hypothetical protein HPB52_011677 [Rhipicephalus sanguineus]